MNDRYIFRFVGLIQSFNNNIIIVYPKYINEKNIENDFYKNNQKKLIQIMKVISKYKNRVNQNLISPNKIEELNFNNLGTKIKILNTYFTTGLYTKEKEIFNNNGRGQILWNKTVNINTAHIINDIPIYLDLQSVEKDIDSFNIVRNIQISILNYISIQISPILEILNIPKVILDTIEIFDKSKIDYYLYILNNQLKNEFVTSKQNIEELIIFLKNESKYLTDTIEIFGTTNFELVWEDVCSHTYHNHLNFSLKSLGLQTKKSISSNCKLKDYIEKPKWLNNQNCWVQSEATLELDVLNINKPYFIIYDAKYYNIEITNRRINNKPGVADITKQYLYQLVFEELINTNSLIPYNFFIVPKDNLDEDKSILTSVYFDMFEKIGLKAIDVIGRDCEKIFEEYLAKI